MSYRKIGERLGVSHVTAYQYVKSQIDQVRAESKELAEELIEVELQRMDDALERVTSSQAYQDGEPASISAALRISESRRKLVGADQPTKTEEKTDGTITVLVEYEKQKPLSNDGSDD